MFRDYPVLTRLGIVLIDIILTVISYIIAIKIRVFLGFSTAVTWSEYLNVLLLIIIVWRLFTGYHEAYAGSAYRHIRGSDFELKREISTVFFTVILGCPVVYLVSMMIGHYTRWIAPKSLILLFGITNLMFLSLEKLGLYYIGKFLSKKTGTPKKVIIVGSGNIARDFVRTVRSNPDWRLEIIGLITTKGDDNIKTGFNNIHVLGDITGFTKILHSFYIDELIVAVETDEIRMVDDIVSICDKEGVPLKFISPFFREIISKARPMTIYGIPVINLLPVERNDLEMFLKRLMDIIISLAGIIILLPVFLLIAILIKVDSPGPVFYKWRILGLNKRPLTSYKFRTMVVNADELKKELMDKNEMSGPVFKMSRDPRVTRVGRWLRRYSLDELPQLWSVLKGDLSLVGPRPPLQTEVEFYEGWHRRKLSVKPGITCLWQISGRNEIKDFNEWVRLDLKYINEWSLWLDIKILFKTILVVLRGTGR